MDQTSSGRYFIHAEADKIKKQVVASINNISTQLELSGLDRNGDKRPDEATIIPVNVQILP